MLAMVMYGWITSCGSMAKLCFVTLGKATSMRHLPIVNRIFRCLMPCMTDHYTIIQLVCRSVYTGCLGCLCCYSVYLYVDNVSATQCLVWFPTNKCESLWWIPSTYGSLVDISYYSHVTPGPQQACVSCDQHMLDMVPSSCRAGCSCCSFTSA